MKNILDTLDRLARAVPVYAKAIVAAVTPVVVDAVLDILPELQASNDRTIAALATVVAVFLIPNASRPAVDPAE